MVRQQSWNPTERALRRYARVHLAYEVRVLYAQIEHLAFADGQRLEDAIDLACFEASLVHLRLLDDFFRASPVGDDVVATHYLPTWRPAGFLTTTERQRINGQVAHLAGRRRRPMHNLGRMARRCSARFAILESMMRSGPPGVRARADNLEGAFEAAALLGLLSDHAVATGGSDSLITGS